MADEMTNPDLPYEDYFQIRPLMADMIQQFKKGTVTQAIASAIDAQLEELRQTCYSISAYANLEHAEGKILDDLGDVLNLTRAEAAKLVSMDELVILSDDDYRKYLQYKALLNTAQGTYGDIVNEIKLILGDDYLVGFGESGDIPATVIVEVDSDEGMDLDKLPVLSPAGVELDYSSGSIRPEIHIPHKVDNAVSYGICCGMIHLAPSYEKLYGSYWRSGQYPSLYKSEVDADGNVYDDPVYNAGYDKNGNYNGGKS